MTTHGGPTGVVGATMAVRGTWTGDGDLLVLGRIEGAIDLGGGLTLASSGVIRAEVHVHAATIAGVLIGDLTARDTILITETGRVEGTLRATQVIVRSGATVHGDVILPSDGSPAQPEQLAFAPVPRALPAAREAPVAGGGRAASPRHAAKWLGPRVVSRRG